VATEKEEKAVTAGDIVLIPAGGKNWHGSDKASEFSYIFVVRKEEKAKQLEAEPFHQCLRNSPRLFTFFVLRASNPLPPWWNNGVRG
jgi:hypothetical protein